MIGKKWRVVLGAAVICGAVAVLPSRGASGHWWRHHHHHHHHTLANNQSGANGGLGQSTTRGQMSSASGQHGK